MDLSAMIHGVASSGLFPSRAFLPAFLTALLLRFGDHLPVLRNLPLIRGAVDTPTWFTHGATLVILGLLAAAEVIAAKSEEAEDLLDLVDRYLKPAVAVLCCLGVLSVRDRQAVESIVTPTAQAGLLDTLWVAGTGFLVSYLTGLRADLRLVLKGADEEDDFGVRQLLSWAEDIWVGIGMFIMVLYPLLMLLLLACTFGALRAIRWLLEKREKRHMGACTACGGAIYRCALVCPACGQPHAAPVNVGFFGQAVDALAPDREALALRLAEKRRCPRCATRLPLRQPRQLCPGCRQDPFGTAAFRERYVAAVNRRLWPVLGLGFLFSLVPVVGLIPGVLLCRQKLSGPFSRYVPGGRRFLTRWVVRLVFVLLLSIHWIPGLGGIVIPLVGWLGFRLYRRAFLALCREAPAGAPAPVPVPVAVAAGAPPRRP